MTIPPKTHLSDCATHNEPALPKGPCSCPVLIDLLNSIEVDCTCNLLPEQQCSCGAEFREQLMRDAAGRIGVAERSAHDHAEHLAQFKTEREGLLEALYALGVNGDHYCWCFRNDLPDGKHTGECVDASAAIRATGGEG